MCEEFGNMNLMSPTFHDLPQTTHAGLAWLPGCDGRQLKYYGWEMTRDLLDSWEMNMSILQLRID